MKLVVERSRLVNTLETGSMMAVKTSQKIIAQHIKRFTESKKGTWIDIAAVNSEEEVVVSGNKESIQAFGEFCLNNAVKSQIIPASHAFHSRQMDLVLSEFGQVADKVSTNSPTCLYVSGTLAKFMEKEDFGSQYWQRHLRDTVRFSEAVKVLWNDCKILVEIGAQPILLGLAMGNVSDSSTGVFCPSLRKNEVDWTAIFTAMSKLNIAGVDLNWKLWFGDRKKRAILPTYPFQRQKFWYTSEDEKPVEMPLIHPVLGRQMPSPLSDTIFCHTLKIKDLAYVNDHKVAERIIVPGAAYLECIMAGGREVLQGGGVQVPLTIENLSVEAALLLEKPCNIQTVVASAHSEEGIKYEISIHRQVAADQADKWKRHSHATFNPSLKIPDTIDINVEETKARLTLKDQVEQAYSKIAEMGIQFGPKFQSIVSAWSGKTELLTEINLPEGSEEYICHPIVLDAMIQTFAFRYALTATNDEMGLQLPIGIKKFVWLSKSPTQKMFAYTSWENGDGNVSLYSESGEQLAMMEGLELLKTTVDSFLRTLNSDGLELPSLYEEVWRPTMSVMRARVDLSNLGYPSLETQYVKNCMDTVAKKIEAQKGGFERMDDTFLLLLLRGIQECEWYWPGVGGKLKPADWKAAAPQHLRGNKIIDSFLYILKDEGYLSEEADGEFRIIQNLPSIADCEKKANANSRMSEAEFGDDVLIRFTKRCGQLFTGVLQGKVSQIEYMFPEDPNEAGAFRFYNECKCYKASSF
jgi:myxalamid-type polyketide synthase MxaB